MVVLTLTLPYVLARLFAPAFAVELIVIFVLAEAVPTGSAA